MNLEHCSEVSLVSNSFLHKSQTNGQVTNILLSLFLEPQLLVMAAKAPILTCPGTQPCIFPATGDSWSHRRVNSVLEDHPMTHGPVGVVGGRGSCPAKVMSSPHLAMLVCVGWTNAFHILLMNDLSFV